MNSKINTAGPHVLIIAHDLSVTGGVNNFLRIMRRRIRGRVVSTRFVNGRRKDEKGRIQAIFRILSDYVRFVAVIRRRPYDILHINPSLDFSSMPRELVFVWLSRLFSPRTKIIIFYRGWDWSAVDRLRSSRFARAVFAVTQRRSSRILVLAESFRNALLELGSGDVPIRLMTTMFEGETLSPVLARNPLRKDRQMLFLSRFIPAKRGDSVLNATAKLSSDYPDLRLIMAGDGPERPTLERMAEQLGISDRVTFTGHVGGTDKMQLLAESALFLLPTEHPEGMPNAILEAMAAGEVIITTPVGGIPSIVQDEVNGTILHATDADSLSAAIAPYLEDTALGRAVGAHNRDLAWKTWESDIVSNRIADEYLTLMASDTATPPNQYRTGAIAG